MRRPWKISCCPRRTISRGPREVLRRIDGDSMAGVDVLMPQMCGSVPKRSLSKSFKQLGQDARVDRRGVAELQVDTSTTPGTGFAGRVRRQAILGAIERGVSMPVPTPAGTAPRSPLPSAGPVVHPVVEPWPGDRVEPCSKIRKITADHMIMSRRTSAHVTSFFEIDYSRVAELRRKHKAASADRGVNLTNPPFLRQAWAAALRKHPVVNAAVSGDNIIYRRDVNIDRKSTRLN